MSARVYDIEGNRLKPTKIHCIVAQDPEDENTIEIFEPSEVSKGAESLKSKSKVIGHNIIGYDNPAVKKLLGVDLEKECSVIDTLVLSRLFNPNREGGHSLEAWGYKLGFSKLEYGGEGGEDFEFYDPEMLEYCKRDVELNTKVYKTLKQEAQGFSAYSVQLEHDVYRIIDRQNKTGFKLDIHEAMRLCAFFEERLQQLEDKVHEHFKPKRIETIIEARWLDSGRLSRMGDVRGSDRGTRLSEEEYNLFSQDPNSPVVRVEEVPFNLGSRKQIGEYLIEFGWKPKEFTPTDQPKIDETILGRVKDIPEAKMIAEYLMIQKRLAQVSSWLEVVDHKDSRVYGYVNPNGAVTGRMTHSKPNMAQVPSIDSPYGAECRGCWIVDEGNKLVGIDASGLELRMLAHYMNSKEYTHEILNGDIHTANQKAAGLQSRSQAKTFIYAFLYGAGNEKIGSIVGGSKQQGSRLRERFLNSTPALKSLTTRIKSEARKGFLKGLDGRKLFVRSQHSALNTLLQGAGAIVMKQALVIFDEALKSENLRAKFVANVHDEWQLECHEDDAERVGELGVEAIVQAGRVLKLNCPLDGDYKVGDSWAETH